MAMDVRALSPTELVRLLNSTPAGTVVSATTIHRQMNEAGLRITAAGDPRKVALIKYVAWLVRERDKPKAAPTTYEERKLREAERNRALSKAGRDIGAIPAVEDPHRRAQCKDSFRAFCEQYFPSAFHLEWSDDHLRVIEKIERAVIDGGLFAFAMPRGSGKALALDTPLPTPDGWTTMGDVAVGDYLFDERGRQCRVVFATEVMRDRQCYRVRFSDGQSIVCDGDHLWTVSDRFKRRNPVTLRTADMASRVRIGNRTDRIEHRYAVAMAEPLQCQGERLPIPPYVLGLWLGNGSASGARVTNHAGDVEDLRHEVLRCGEVLEPRPSGDRGLARTGVLTRGGLAASIEPAMQVRLRQMELLGNKHIPARYLRARASDRLALLQGLMDTDGSVSESGACEITLKQGQLTDDLEELLWSLGIKFSASEKWVTLDGRMHGPYRRFGFRGSMQLPVFRLPRKLEKLPAKLRSTAPRRRMITAIEPVPSVPVRCIQVDSSSHLYLAGRGMVPTHNTTLARIAGLWAILYGYRPYVCLIGSAEDQAKSMLDAIKREMLANDLLLADFPEAIYPIRKLENNARRQIGQLCKGKPTYITWSADRLVMPTIDGSSASGAVITVAGLDSNIRGQQHTRMDGTIIRPSLVILDDPQTRQSANSPSQTRHRLSILNGDVLGLGGPGVKMAGFMTCTKIYHDDLADQILDRTKNPEWQGECTKLVYKFPESAEAEKHWDQYAQIRAESLREGGDAPGSEATAYYEEHREVMDAGSAVAWPVRFNHDEVSALQHAMNLKLRDEPAFFAEYQNEPVAEQSDEDVLSPDQVAQRTNGRPRKQVPLECTRVTAFIDVHDKVLFYVVCAWAEDFTGYVIDYGTYPDQKRALFSLRDAKKTLGDLMPGAGVEGAVQAGLEQLATTLLTTDYPQGEGSIRIERLLIDSGYLPGVVANVCHQLPSGGSGAMPSKGVGIKAGNKPMSTYRRRPGERHGHHWYVPNVSKTSEFRHVQIDTNYWKSFLHARLAVAPGDRGALTLYGDTASRGSAHRLFADHVAGAEFWTRTQGHGRMVQEWAIRPSRPDNHWFDCLVGCAVAASMGGVKLGVEPIGAPRKARMKLSEMQASRR